MSLIPAILLAALGAASTALETRNNIFDSRNYAPNDVITRDVAVIGGGSAGTYGAINLCELGQSVVVVEKEAVLGGHTNTYTDPKTNTTVDYGLQAFWNSSVTLEYFSHLNISLVKYSPGNFSYFFADFKNGKKVRFDLDEDFDPWAAQLAKYPWLDESWNVSYPVAEDLLLPFSEFITKYNLSDLAYGIYFSAEGLSDPLQQVTVNVMKMVDPVFLNELTGAAVVPASHDNSELYNNALTKLGSDALLESVVISAQRPANGSAVSLVVQTPSGIKLIKASKLLVAMPQVLENMHPFDLDATESGLFSQWKWMGYYTLLIENTGLPMGYEYVNANASSKTYHIPELPGVSQITPSRISGIFYAWYRSPTNLTQAEVEADTIATIQILQQAQNLTASTPKILEYRSHTPYKLEVPAEAISNGFYKGLEGLQGHRSTWYTGAAFISHDSPVIWEYTQNLLPQIVAA